MYSIWTQHLETAEDKARFLGAVEGAQPVLEVLAELIYRKQTELERSEKSLKSYDNPNWSHKQAHLNGYDSACDAIINILTSRPKEQ